MLSLKLNPTTLQADHPARQFIDIWPSLSLSEEGVILMDSSKIVVPLKIRKPL